MCGDERAESRRRRLIVFDGCVYVFVQFCYDTHTHMQSFLKVEHSECSSALLIVNEF